MEGIRGAKLAATVLLVRDSALGMEVYVQERVAEMPTFPNTTVFPGGVLDERDLGDGDGVEAQRWSTLLQIEPAIAHGLVMAAVREVFEETGILLARHRTGELVSDAVQYHYARPLLENHELAFTDFLHDNDLTVATDLLYPFARWVGPGPVAPKFDAFSFVAQAPLGQMPDGATREAASTGWFLPSVILGGWKTGLLRLVIPTWAQLTALTEFHTVADLEASLINVDMTPIIGDPDDPFFDEFFLYGDLPERF
ncbi:NUDIX domain-containing protein [Corynebacterium hindlerae]|uniref:NUDIX domain-containing protein n=1 Tax=Corynebacterium hindlerae TaxID=699041 RepID=A0A7G5FER1_9CORY|nr:NUDIX domain-containing protein [Corynebacterium hindlerae]QMV85102.1 NUDIX domain-containing protein [Corynebacterium hindlerae]